jgi:hypothetical protein
MKGMKQKEEGRLIHNNGQTTIFRKKKRKKKYKIKFS